MISIIICTVMETYTIIASSATFSCDHNTIRPSHNWYINLQEMISFLVKDLQPFQCMQEYRRITPSSFSFYNQTTARFCLNFQMYLLCHFLVSLKLEKAIVQISLTAKLIFSSTIALGSMIAANLVQQSSILQIRLKIKIGASRYIRLLISLTVKDTKWH